LRATLRREWRKKTVQTALVEALKWQMEIGVDVIMADEAIDRTQVKPKLATSQLTASHSPSVATNKLNSTAQAIALNEVNTPEINIPPRSSDAILGASEACADARKLAAEAKDLKSLQKIIEEFEGCPLKRTAMKTVFSDGCETAKIMIVGDAPGADEDRLGKAFAGVEGLLLDKMLAAIDLSREKDVYLTNVINWRPPGNRSVSDSEVAICLPFIKRHIELVKPDILVCVGTVAAKALLETTQGITRTRGKWFEYQSEGMDKMIKATVLFHPGYLIATPGQKRLAWADLLQLKEKMA